MVIYETQTTYVKKNVEAIALSNTQASYNHAVKFPETHLNPTVENVILVGLNNRNFVLFTKVLTTGTISNCLLKPTQLFRELIVNNCSAFIVFHNHPSGDPSPSTADLKVTQALKQTSSVMEFTFHDHIILGQVENDPTRNGFYSMREMGHI
jgi:DNA repair protein RadC